MSETMSSSPSNDWVQLYQHNLSRQVQTKPAAADATTTTTTSASSGLIPEGRVSKPVRKRSRASRRTPTTLLNTDTANFRAMVQQFTGGPASSPFTSAGYPSGPNVNFGLGTSQNRNAVMVPRTVAGINFVQLQQFEDQQYMVSVNNSTTRGGQLGFLQSSRSGGVLGVSGGNRLESSVSSSVRSSSFNNPINRENYMF